MPSTITIIPAMNTMVDQLMPVLDSDEPTQKLFWIKQLRFSVSQMAPPSCMHRPNTSTSTRAPLPSVTHWRGNRSQMMRANITTKMATARIFSMIVPPLSSEMIFEQYGIVVSAPGKVNPDVLYSFTKMSQPETVFL